MGQHEARETASTRACKQLPTLFAAGLGGCFSCTPVSMAHRNRGTSKPGRTKSRRQGLQRTATFAVLPPPCPSLCLSLPLHVPLLSSCSRSPSRSAPKRCPALTEILVRRLLVLKYWYEHGSSSHPSTVRGDAGMQQQRHSGRTDKQRTDRLPPSLPPSFSTISSLSEAPLTFVIIYLLWSSLSGQALSRVTV